MNLSKIGARYAKALFEFALEQDKLEEVKRDMETVDNTAKNSRELRRLLENPVLHNNTKKAAVKAVFEKYIGEIVLRYLMIIVQGNREDYLPDIAAQFVEQYKHYKNIKTAYLSTAQQVSDEMRQAVVSTLEEQTKAEIELVEEIKSELIGGLILKVDDQEMNLSLRKRLKKLSREFEVNIYQGKY